MDTFIVVPLFIIRLQIYHSSVDYYTYVYLSQTVSKIRFFMLLLSTLIIPNFLKCLRKAARLK